MRLCGRRRPLLGRLLVPGQGEEEGEYRLQAAVPQVLSGDALHAGHMLGPEDAQAGVDVVQLEEGCFVLTCLKIKDSACRTQ